MPKIKTHQATAKRFKVKKSNKKTKPAVQVITRTGGQDHFNSRESGNTKRNKRSDITLSKTVHKTILRALPHSK